MSMNKTNYLGYFLLALFLLLVNPTLTFAQFLSPPTLISPSNGSGNLTLPVTLVWDHSTATSFHVQVATDASFNNLVVNQSGVTNTFYELNSLAENTTFYWRVNATLLLVTSDWSSTWSFTTAPIQTIPNAPNLLSPPNGATDISLNPVLEWESVSNADYYHLQVAEDASFSNVIFDNSNITGTTQQVGPLNNLTGYYWRVNASNGAGTSGWSSVWSFTTVTGQTIPNAPNLLSPPNGATDISLNPVLEWESVSNADYYHLQVAEDASFNNMIFDNSNITGTTQQVGPLNNLTGYYWRVNASNGAGTSGWSSVWSFTTVAGQTIPNAPNLVSPADGSIDISLSPVLVWEIVPNADTYRVQVAADNSFNNIIYDEGGLTNISQQINSLSSSTEYFWRVNAKNSAGTSAWSSVWSFTTQVIQTIPNIPNLISPPDGAINISLNPILQWENISNADYYRLQVAEDNSFTTIVFDEPDLIGSSQQVNTLNSSTEYFWRVNARNGAGTSGWSPVWSFTTQVVQSIPNTPNLISPSNGAIDISLNPILQWENISNADYYRLQVAEDNSFTTIVFDNPDLTSSSQQINSLNSATEYFWRVNARNSAGTSGWSSAWSFTTQVVQSVPNAPNLVYPPDGTSEVSLNPVLQWESVSNAEHYRLQVAVDNTFTITVFDDANITATTQQVGPLLNSTQYYWRVNARNSTGTSDWSSVWDFTTQTIQTIPNAPNLVSPANSATEISLNPVLDWESVTNADYYRLQVAEDGSFTNIIYNDSAITTSSRQISTLNTETQYYWRVNARNSAGTSGWSPVWNFTTVSQLTVPSAPNLVSPPNSTTDESLYPILTWSQISNADKYRLQVALDASFNVLAFDDSNITSNYRQFGPLDEGTKYYWRVNARNGAGTSNWSTFWSFTTTISHSMVPPLISPGDGLRNLPLSVMCVWDSVDNAIKYQLQVSIEPDFSNLFSNDSTNVTYKEVESLSNGTTYFWRVRAKVENSWQQYSAPWQFTTRNSAPNYINIDTSIAFPLYQELSSYKSTDYKIVGLPGVSTIPVTDFLPGSFGSDWQAFWDNGSPENYMIEYNANDFFFTVGKAFWIIKKGSMDISTTIEDAPLNNNQNVEVPLHSGWNLITNPLTVPVPWDTIMALNGITEPIYSFEGSYNTDPMFQPFKGYYFFNSTNLSIFQVPSEVSPEAPVANGIPFLKKDIGINDWIVNIKLFSGDYTDSIMWLGVSSAVENEFNHLDFHKPRNWGSVPSVYFFRNNWDENYPVFASDITPPFDVSNEWDFEIKSDPGKTTTLIFNIKEVPEWFDILLYNTITEKWTNLKNDNSYRFTPDRDITTLKVKIGKNLKEKLIADIPSQFELGNNYPNPFNPSTTIPVSIPERSDIEITIFNILGNRITTIYSGSLNPGKHYFNWNGTNDRGEIVSSGIYFYRLTAKNSTNIIKKMTLLK